MSVQEVHERPSKESIQEREGYFFGHISKVKANQLVYYRSLCVILVLDEQRICAHTQITPFMASMRITSWGTVHRLIYGAPIFLKYLEKTLLLRAGGYRQSIEKSSRPDKDPMLP
jgi:hypothetical protein